jgi:hypothetical protein
VDVPLDDVVPGEPEPAHSEVRAANQKMPAANPKVHA